MEEIPFGLVNRKSDLIFSSYKSAFYLRLNKKVVKLFA